MEFIASHALAVSLPLCYYLPAIAIAYAVGRRRITLRLIILLVVLEAIAIAWTRWLSVHTYDWPPFFDFLSNPLHVNELGDPFAPTAP